MDCDKLNPQLFSFGQVDDEGDGGGSQCCLLVVDGAVVSRFVGYD